MRCTKAIIPVAGYGTRWLPLTKSIEKCMLPIGNRPIVDYTVQDCAKAGITDIYFVVGQDSTQLQDYYSRDVVLESYLKKKGRGDIIDNITPPRGVTFHYIEQDLNKAYGTAVPIALCRSYIPKGEPVLICMGDDCVYSDPGVECDLERLVVAAEQSGTAAMLGVQIPISQVERYGVIETNDRNEFVQIVEKPKPSDAPSNQINVGKYVFTSELLDECVKYESQKQINGEFYITEPINTYVENAVMIVIPTNGAYLDAGTVDGWLHANQFIAEQSR